MGEEDVAYIFPGDSVVKNLPANAGDTGDVDLVPGSAYPPKEEKATHSSILALKIPWTEAPGVTQSMGLQRVRNDTHPIPKMGYYSTIERNEIMPFVATWMNLEVIILSEVSQRKTNIIYNLYEGSKKLLQMNLFTKQNWTHRRGKQT